jgi:hypothetical protein
MPDQNLRRRALESGKTTSNKAKSKQSSRASSRPQSAANSRAASRLQSRDASDDEGHSGNFSDHTDMSINSIDELLESDELFNEQTTDVLKQELIASIDDLVERKGSSVNSRVESLKSCVRSLSVHYFADALYGRTGAFFGALLKSVDKGSSEEEITLALHAIALVAVTDDDENFYETVSPSLKRTIADSPHQHAKAVAIDTLAACLVFGGAGDAEIEETLTFLLEIVSSDGSFVSADDSADVVVAALEAYGFLATFAPDLEAESEDAVAGFLEQLDSSNARVLIAAGENIALLYEKSFTPRLDDSESDDEHQQQHHHQHAAAESSSDDDNDDDDDNFQGDASLTKRYDAYHNTHEILDKVRGLASLSTKQLNRKDKRDLHASFTCIGSTLDDPRVGLVSNAASKMIIEIASRGAMNIDKWWKLKRAKALRRLLGGGFQSHYFEGNKRVLDALPLILRPGGAGPGGRGVGGKSPANKASKGRWRNERRFVNVGADDGD